MRRRLGRTVRGVVGNARGSRWAWSREGDGRLLDNKERRGAAKPRPGAGASVPLPSSQPRQMSRFPPQDSAGRSGCPSRGRACGFLPDGGHPTPARSSPSWSPTPAAVPLGLGVGTWWQPWTGAQRRGLQARRQCTSPGSARGTLGPSHPPPSVDRRMNRHDGRGAQTWRPPRHRQPTGNICKRGVDVGSRWPFPPRHVGGLGFPAG